MKKYITIEVDNNVEKNVIEKIWGVMKFKESKKYSKFEFKVEDSYIRSVEMTNEYNIETISIDEIKINNNIKSLFVENKHDFWLLTL